MKILLSRKCEACGKWSLTKRDDEPCATCRQSFGPRLRMGLDVVVRKADPK